MKVLIAGDFVPHQRVADQIENGKYDCLEEVKPLIQSADYSIVNFESPVVAHKANPIDKTGPNICCTDKAMECIAKAGFNCVTLANNHFRDYGQVGVDDTIDSCLKHNISFVGGGKTRMEAKKILYQNIDGKNLAIINVCENEWSIADENYGGSNPIHPIRNHYAIREAKKNADYVLVIVHGGIEGFPYPTPRMQETYRFFVDSGADAVINHHQHCYSGYEVFNGKPIFYGLGNFCFDKNNPKDKLWTEGYFVMLDCNKEGISFNVVPYVQGGHNPTVVPMTETDKQVFDEKIDQINSVIGNPNKLQQRFKKLVEEKTDYRMLALEPIDNKFIKMLQKKHLFPRLVKKEQKKSMLMRIQCESNRELLIGILNKFFKM